MADDWPPELRRHEAEVTGEPLMPATSEALNVPPRDKRDVALAKARRALTGIDTFAWSALTADCEASRKECMRRVTLCRDALVAIETLVPDAGEPR